jgi:hypothetical protein
MCSVHALAFSVCGVLLGFQGTFVSQSVVRSSNQHTVALSYNSGSFSAFSRHSSSRITGWGVGGRTVWDTCAAAEQVLFLEAGRIDLAYALNVLYLDALFAQRNRKA